MKVSEFRLFIKGMVCQRCIIVIKRELQNLGLTPVHVKLGEVTVITSDTTAELEQIENTLRPLGFQLLEDRKIKTVKEVKKLVAQVYSGNYDFPVDFRFSDVVVSALHKDYDTISSLFSLLEHKTLERYIIDFRIEKVKEFLVYSSLPLGDIAFRLNFSSVAHLSRQFKQHTGLTTSHFRNIRNAKAGNPFSHN